MPIAVYTTTYTIPPSPSLNDINNFNAIFIAQSVPTTMAVGTSATVSITMLNTGHIAWDYITNNYNLASKSPDYNTTWGLDHTFSAGQFDDETGECTNVEPGQTFTYTFTITAPTTPGTYNFQWQMEAGAPFWSGGIWYGDNWFGSLTPATTITIVQDKMDQAPNWVESQNITCYQGDTITIPASGGLGIGAYVFLDAFQMRPTSQLYQIPGIQPNVPFTVTLPPGIYDFEVNKLGDYIYDENDATGYTLTVLPPPSAPSPSPPNEPVVLNDGEGINSVYIPGD